ncbi:hypothetical protein BC829DRAFT_417338 [Chytridium lagenaria]|nr:hypothetical protein BC829DRAFT_417338 [Chytridium lagenaria]
MSKMLMLVISAFIVVFCGLVVADEHSHVYEVASWPLGLFEWRRLGAGCSMVNSVGPVDNRQETYEYFQLPYCPGPIKVKHHHESLAEALLGVSLANSGIDIGFKKTVANATICKRALKDKEITIFRYAVGLSYYYQMYIGIIWIIECFVEPIKDDLPIYDYVGENDENGGAYIYTHRHFVITYNDNWSENESDKLLPVPAGKSELNVEFTYSVTWKPTTDKFETRFLKSEMFFEHKIHWFSIFNSFMMVVFLLGLVVVVLLRTLKRDLARYDKEQSLLELERDLPSHLAFAVLGTGLQLAILVFAVLLYAVSGDYYVEQAKTLSASFLYAVTSIVSGYYTGSFYTKYGGKNWVRLIFVTSSLWPGVVSILVLGINFIAIAKSSSRAIRFGSMIAVLCIWIFCVFPLVLMGVILGRNWSGDPNFPCRINPIPRPIPDQIWYTQPVALIMLAGMLPFASVFIEMYFVFSSFWKLKYYMFSFMMLVFVILVVSTACIAIVSTCKAIFFRTQF